MTDVTLHSLRCGIILAGGEGRRVQPLVRRLLGFELPKQYVSFIGTRSMLEHTFDRVDRLVPPDRIFTVIAQDHLKHAEVHRQIGKRPSHTVVSQPLNRETGPGLLFPLMHLLRHYPNSTVAVFPSDHFVLQENLFMSFVQRAFEAVERDPAKIVFLGVKPTDPESEYGYILPGKQVSDSTSSARSIKAFLEKPHPQVAGQVVSLGALWNTMIMVFKPEILLHLVSRSAPGLHGSFQRIFRALGTSHESSVIEMVYENMEPVNLSKDLLENFDLHSPNLLSVIAMEEVLWSDWGSEERIISVLNKLSCLDRLLGEFSLHGAPDQLPAIGATACL